MFPMLQIAIICTTFEALLGLLSIIYEPLNISSILNRTFGIVIGSQKALAGLWFVYTLLVCKCILQYTEGNKYSIYIHILFLCVFAVLSVALEGTFLKT